MKKHGQTPKQKTKPEKNQQSQKRVRRHMLQKIDEADRSITPPLRPAERSCNCFFYWLSMAPIFIFSLVMFVFIIFMNCVPIIDPCSRAELLVHKLCSPQLEKLKNLTNMTIPDFSMTQIGIGIAEKWDRVEECLHAVTCSTLQSSNQFPERCAIYQFFDKTFASCREELRKLKKPPKCLKAFLKSEPVPCDILHRHLACYKRLINEVCEPNDDFKSRFQRFTWDYMDIIQCKRDDDDDDWLKG